MNKNVKWSVRGDGIKKKLQRPRKRYSEWALICVHAGTSLQFIKRVFVLLRSTLSTVNDNFSQLSTLLRRVTLSRAHIQSNSNLSSSFNMPTSSSYMGNVNTQQIVLERQLLGKWWMISELDFIWEDYIWILNRCCWDAIESQSTPPRCHNISYSHRIGIVDLLRATFRRWDRCFMCSGGSFPSSVFFCVTWTSSQSHAALLYDFNTSDKNEKLSNEQNRYTAQFCTWKSLTTPVRILSLCLNEIRLNIF